VSLPVGEYDAALAGERSPLNGALGIRNGPVSFGVRKSVAAVPTPSA
jgi:hypothetical protein